MRVILGSPPKNNPIIAAVPEHTRELKLYDYNSKILYTTVLASIKTCPASRFSSFSSPNFAHWKCLSEELPVNAQNLDGLVVRIAVD